MIVLSLSCPQSVYSDHLLVHLVRAQPLDTDELIGVIDLFLRFETFRVFKLKHPDVFVGITQENEVTVERDRDAQVFIGLGLNLSVHSL